MKLYIKNMVCPRCVRVVREELEALKIPVREVTLGEVELAGPLPEGVRPALEQRLKESGFELLSSREEQTVEQVKQLIIQHVWGEKKKPAQLNFSDYLAGATYTGYAHLSRLFSSLSGMTIEQYLIRMKIERVKELLIYGQQTLSEIAYELDYSSPQHLSGQFRKVTGATPSEFKKWYADSGQRASLDSIADQQ